MVSAELLSSICTAIILRRPAVSAVMYYGDQAKVPAPCPGCQEHTDESAEEGTSCKTDALLLFQVQGRASSARQMEGAIVHDGPQTGKHDHFREALASWPQSGCFRPSGKRVRGQVLVWSEKELTFFVGAAAKCQVSGFCSMMSSSPLPTDHKAGGWMTRSRRGLQKPCLGAQKLKAVSGAR